MYACLLMLTGMSNKIEKGRHQWQVLKVLANLLLAYLSETTVRSKRAVSWVKLGTLCVPRPSLLAMPASTCPSAALSRC